VRAPVAPAGATAPTATTGPATGIAKTAATLTGQIKTGSQPTAYFFQFGTNTSYGSITPVAYINADGGVNAVISHLKRATVYHYRLVAINDSGASFGADMKFKTKGSSFLGSLVLDGTNLPVKNGDVQATFTCKSSKACSGLFSITTTLTTTAKAHKPAPVVCTVSRLAKYRIGAHKTKTISVPLHQACLTALAAHGGKLHGKLTTRPRTAQRGTIRLVTLIK
jgi:hypothetical protein